VKRKGFVRASAAALSATSWLAASLGARSADSTSNGSSFSLTSDGIGATFSTSAGALRIVGLQNRLTGEAIPIPRELFQLTFADGNVRKASDFAIVSGPVVHRAAGNPLASRYSDRIASTTVTVELRDAVSGASCTWSAIASDGARYMRQELRITAHGAPLQVRDVRAIDFPHLPDAEVAGSCDGSPIVAGDVFLAVEHPFAQADAIYDRASASLPRKVDIEPGVPLVLSSVVGVVRPGQLRRDFLAYVERERAHPYRTFLHYNSWYDIGYFTPYDQTECLSRIQAFGNELHTKRGVALASFLFDDGWDDPNRLWTFNAGFPNGFAPLAAAAAEYGAKPGAWLSPWGGYGKPREERLAAAQREGYEIDAGGLALSGPKYYDYFHSVTMQFIARGGVNQFKIDGTGDNATVVPGSRFGNNFEAAIALIADMRAAEPDIYVNLTTGTYPSPFWLRYCDSIWRGGNDHDFAGPGTHRQRWITYRDADTYAGIVAQGPLYPLNSLMLHGLIFAQHALHLNDDPHGDFASEVRSYFGSGTQLQEMYVSPELLSTADWNQIAESARWSADNAAVLCDTHWVGGNPGRLDVYGWASWSPRKGILVLRNPSDSAQSIPIDLARAFELPQGAPEGFAARPVGKAGTHERLVLRAGREHMFALAPFEVLVLDLFPESARG
jgi:hypothetical protein